MASQVNNPIIPLFPLDVFLYFI